MLNSKQLRKLQLSLVALSLLAVACEKGFEAVNGQQYPQANDNYFMQLAQKKALEEAELKASSGVQHEQKAQQLALTQWQSNDFAQAQKYFGDQWANESKDSIQHYDPAFVKNGLNLAACDMDNGAFPQARTAYESLLQYEKVRLPADDSKIARDYNNLGLCVFMLAKTKPDWSSRTKLLNEALADYKTAQEIWQQHNDSQPQLTYCLQNEAMARSELPQSDGAEVLSATVEKTIKSWPKPGA